MSQVLVPLCPAAWQGLQGKHSKYSNPGIRLQLPCLFIRLHLVTLIYRSGLCTTGHLNWPAIPGGLDPSLYGNTLRYWYEHILDSSDMQLSSVGEDGGRNIWRTCKFVFRYPWLVGESFIITRKIKREKTSKSVFSFHYCYQAPMLFGAHEAKCAAWRNWRLQTGRACASLETKKAIEWMTWALEIFQADGSILLLVHATTLQAVQPCNPAMVASVGWAGETWLNSLSNRRNFPKSPIFLRLSVFSSKGSVCVAGCGYWDPFQELVQRAEKLHAREEDRGLSHSRQARAAEASFILQFSVECVEKVPGMARTFSGMSLPSSHLLLTNSLWWFCTAKYLVSVLLVWTNHCRAKANAV